MAVDDVERAYARTASMKGEKVSSATAETSTASSTKNRSDSKPSSKHGLGNLCNNSMMDKSVCQALGFRITEECVLMHWRTPEATGRASVAKLS
mmetsp:Transcript_7406/g.11098  ORF Transcript_7406/g.11098 Transcript_7406/m.11098 type:complete len:94 (+) Transcript_7406:1642-1923(+)